MMITKLLVSAVMLLVNIIRGQPRDCAQCCIGVDCDDDG